MHFQGRTELNTFSSYTFLTSLPSSLKPLVVSLFPFSFTTWWNPPCLCNHIAKCTSAALFSLCPQDSRTVIWFSHKTAPKSHKQTGSEARWASCTTETNQLTKVLRRLETVFISRLLQSKYNVLKIFGFYSRLLGICKGGHVVYMFSSSLSASLASFDKGQ